MPEQGSDSSGDNSEAREVPAEGCTDGHWVGDVEPGADHTVENERDGTNKTTEDDAYDSLTPV